MFIDHEQAGAEWVQAKLNLALGLFLIKDNFSSQELVMYHIRSKFLLSGQNFMGELVVITQADQLDQG